MTFSKNPIWKLACFLIVLLMGSCTGCSEEQILANLNNGNDNPAVLILETWGTEIRGALDIGFGGDCLGTANFPARVSIEVRTADWVNNQVVPSPTPFFDATLINQSFFNNNSTNAGTQFTIDVPETGAYLLSVEVELNNCSICCHGIGTNQCGDNNSNNQCEAGLPRVRLEQIFTVDTRPDHTMNHVLNASDFVVR